MSRVEIDYVVQGVDASSGRVSAINAASVQINVRNADGTSGAAATLYTTPDLGTNAANPVTTDSSGRISRSGNRVWLEPGRYNLVVTTGVTTVTQAWDVPDSAYATVASAATVTIPVGCTIANITGTTGITSITAATIDAGRRVTLIFAAALTVTDGSNLKLASNYTTTADDTMTVVCDGTNWYEVSRSVN